MKERQKQKKDKTNNCLNLMIEVQFKDLKTF